MLKIGALVAGRMVSHCKIQNVASGDNQILGFSDSTPNSASPRDGEINAEYLKDHVFLSIFVYPSYPCVWYTAVDLNVPIESPFVRNNEFRGQFHVKKEKLHLEPTTFRNRNQLSGWVTFY